MSDSPFSYLRFVDVSPQEQFQSFYSLLHKWLQISSEKLKNTEQLILHRKTWKSSQPKGSQTTLLLWPERTMSSANVAQSPNLSELIFTRSEFLEHRDLVLHQMQETVSHRLMRNRKNNSNCDNSTTNDISTIQKEMKPQVLKCQRCPVPKFLMEMCPRVCTSGRVPFCSDRSFAYFVQDHVTCSGQIGKQCIMFGSDDLAQDFKDQRNRFRFSSNTGGIYALRPSVGFSNIIIPDKQSLVSDCGKLHVLDVLLARLKSEGHRVLIYSQMTKMIDLLEEFMWHRKHTFMRLDGSSKISERRDMVADFQERSDIFVFLLSTRAGGLGINLTAADTVSILDNSVILPLLNISFVGDILRL